MRRVEFAVETDDDGRMAFRARRIFGLPKWEMLPAADGQLGAVVRLYRDWKLSGDDGFLRSLWEKAARALDFAFDFWDTDGDAVLDSEQHNTYDIEFYGPNSLMGSIFYAALKAGAEMAAFMGDDARSARYQRALTEGSARMDALLWSGEYYIQKIADVDEYRYQYGTGCLSDQLLGQTLAHVAGLGYILPRNHVKAALKSIFRHNFCRDLRGNANAQRTYVLDGEAGLLLCTWPHGGRPRLPFVYCDEVWTGIEYQVATHLIYEGMVKEGLEIVKAVRDRHDGVKRNPWNEVECGHHYVRSLASWGLLPALSGFAFDMTRKRISFSPVINAKDFSCFFATGTAWGVYRQRVDSRTGKRTWDVEVMEGSLDGVTVNEEGRQMRITSRELAKICGVSIGTVDRALNNRPGINPQTKERILRAGQELGYRPHLVARSLKMGRTSTVGIVVYDLDNRFFAQLVNSIESAARESGYFVYLTLSHHDLAQEKGCLEHLAGLNVDGILMVPTNKGNEFIRFVKSLPVPVVAMGNKISQNVPFVGIKDREAIRAAVGVIAEKGYTRVIYVSPPLSYGGKENIYEVEERYDGFREGVRERSLSSAVIRDKHFEQALAEEVKGSCSGKRLPGRPAPPSCARAISMRWSACGSWDHGGCEYPRTWGFSGSTTSTS